MGVTETIELPEISAESKSEEEDDQENPVEFGVKNPTQNMDALVEAATLMMPRTIPWTFDEEILFTGFLINRFLLKGRLFAPKSVARKFGRQPAMLLWDDCKRVMDLLKYHFLKSDTVRKASSYERRLKEIRDKNKWGNQTKFIELHKDFIQQFHGNELLTFGTLLFDDGASTRTEIELVRALRRGLKHCKCHILSNFSMDKPHEVELPTISSDYDPGIDTVRFANISISKLFVPERKTGWRYEESMILVAMIIKRFLLTGSLFPSKPQFISKIELPEGIGRAKNDAIWSEIKDSYDRALGRFNTVVHGGAAAFHSRSKEQLSRRFKTIKGQIHEQEALKNHTGYELSVFSQLFLDFCVVNQNCAVDGNMSPDIDAGAESKRILDFLEKKKVTTMPSDPSSEYYALPQFPTQMLFSATAFRG